MNIVFFGSDNFALPSLKALLVSGHKISCVVTQPDKRGGRGLHLEGTAVKAVAREAGITVYQPAQINSGEAIEFLKRFRPDLSIVISYGQILSQNILDIPGIFSVNVHASILPKYRGAAPINWAIINAEKTTGITIIKMTASMDAGPIIAQAEVAIEDPDTAVTLEDKLSKKAPCILLDSLKLIEDKTCNLIEQDEIKASFAPKLKKNDGLINWQEPAQSIYNLIRGSLGWPGAFTYYKGKLFKIYKARVASASGERRVRAQGEILQVSREGIVVACATDNLIIEELQIEGKRRMIAQDFIAGHKIPSGEILGRK
jgi:methionyl-tRNA formyltransferase